MAAAHAEEPAVDGQLTFAQATMEGSTNATAAFDVAYASAFDQGIQRGAWEVEAEYAVVNWSYQYRVGAGSHPNNPETSLLTVKRDGYDESDQMAYPDVRISAAFESSRTEFLLRPIHPDAASMGVENASSVTVAPSEGEEWAVGLQDPESVRGGVSDDELLVHAHSVDAGRPIMSVLSGLTWQADGDMVLYVWDSSVTVHEADGNATTYRSGTWTTNATGETPATPRGVVREEHAQLLRITVVNATLTWRHDSGALRWTATETAMETSGRVTYADAYGDLESGAFVYEAAGDAVILDGRVAQRLAASDASADALVAQVDAHDVRVNLVPAGRTSSVAPEAGPATASVLMWAAWIVGAVAVLVGAAWWLYRRRVFDPQLELWRAQDALAAGRVRRARWRARRVLRRDVGSAEAWFVYGATLLHDGAYERFVDKADRAPAAVQAAPSVAFLVGTAHYHLDAWGDAFDALAVAADDPEFLERIRTSQLFEDARSDARFRRLFLADAGAGYA